MPAITHTPDFVETAVSARATSKTTLRKRLLMGLAGAVVLSGAGYAAWYETVGAHYVSTDNAYVGADVAQINSQISGPIARVAVTETQMVHKGDILVEIDPSDAKLAVAQAEANYRNTLQRVSQYYAQRSGAAATVAARISDVSRTADLLARGERLAQAGAIAQQQLATERTDAAAARANLSAAQEALKAQDEMVNGVGVDTHPETVAARAALAKAQLDLSRTLIRAPIDGIVAQRKAQVGQSVQPGQALMTVTPIQQAYVDANFKEGQLTNVRIGQPVKMTSDLYGSKVVFHGRVQGMDGGTGSAFAVIPAQNATGHWIKVVQRVPVRIDFNDANQPSFNQDGRLRPGLSVVPDVRVR